MFRKSKMFNEKYHDNCHDYVKGYYLERYANRYYIKFLYSLAETVPVVDICKSVDSESYADTIVCDQHAVVFTRKTDYYPIIATYALNACIGLVMYNNKYGVAALAHIDGLPGYSQQSAREDGLAISFSPVQENIDAMMKTIRYLTGASLHQPLDIDYYLIGGIFNLSEVMIHDIVEYIGLVENKNKSYRFHLKGRNLLGPENQSRNISIDSRTGSVNHFNYIDNAAFYQNSKGDNGLPINIVKAPRQSEAFLDTTYVSM